jgi:hypothetical protein
MTEPLADAVVEVISLPCRVDLGEKLDEDVDCLCARRSGESLDVGI